MGHDEGSFFVDDRALAGFSELDFSIYNAILRNRNRIVGMRICDIAKIAGVSNASVVRFSKKCGYSGFPELRMAVAAQPGNTQQPALPSVMQDLDSFEQDSGHATFQRQIDDAFELLRWVNGVLFVGNGRSGGLAEYGASLFCSLGLMSVSVTALPSYITTVRHPDAGAIVVSHRGSSPQLLTAVQELSANGVKIISVTGNAQSPLARLSDVCIGYRVPSHPNAVSDSVDTHIPAMLAIEELARRLYNETFSLL